MFVYIVIISIFVGVSLTFWLTKTNEFWKKKGIPFALPRLFVGNMGELVLMKKSMHVIVTEHYQNAKDLPYLGMYNMMQPILLVMDPELIRRVLVSDFNKFRDNTFELNEEADPILAKNPFFLKGERWKIVRGQLTPLLTNSKVKAMLPLVQEVCKIMTRYLEEQADATGKDGLETKELALKFTIDNVTSCAFGIEGRSFDDPNAEFRKMSESFLQFSTWGLIKFTLITLFPSLNKLLKLSITQNDVSDKFKKILTDTVKYRKENNIKRNDFLDSIIELRSKPMPFEYTDDYMVSHAFSFFIDGSETSATVLSFALYELAANPDIQSKLKAEIDQVLPKYNDTVTFEAILEMPYLDAVFNETLRKHPPLMVMSRECTQETKFPAPAGSTQEFTIEKGNHIFIPTLGIHRDPQYYPDPDVFDPERFTDDAKHPLPKNCFFGFGDGPRICLGQRFANMQIKLGLVEIISNFELRVNKKTKVPVVIDQSSLLLSAAGGLWLNFYKRNNN